MSEAAVASLKLQPSETAVLHAASRIFAAWIAAGKVTPENQGQVLEESIGAAIQMAKSADDRIFSDDEAW